MPRPSTASPGKSPSKQRPSAAGGSVEQIVADATHNMQMLVSEKEIEIERLKTTVVSLNSKCAIVDDHLEDVKNSTNRFEDSEA